jgi:hypothetical protein
VPRIADEIVECSVYLYSSKKAAMEGHQAGGSGFLVHVPSDIDKTYSQIYAVTNRHILDEGFTVLRLTKKSGGIDTFPTERQSWIPHPLGYDVEVLPIELPRENFRWRSVSTDLFISPEIIETYRIGLGDDAFLIGRLVTHEGKQKNSPIVRFGNVSLMADPNEPIRCKGYDQEGFLVECRSLSGFSGSPVFVQTERSYSGEDAARVAQARRDVLFHTRETTNPPGKVESFSWVRNDPPQNNLVTISGRFGPWLLGIDWGHIPLWRPVYDSDQQTRTSYRVEANTGVAGVLPAWHILEALNSKELLKHRREEGRKLAKRLAAESSAASQPRYPDEPSFPTGKE